MNRNNLKGAAIHIASWAVGYWLAYSIMGHSSNKGTYGLIVAWWMACYVGYIANVGIEAAVFAFLVYVVTLATGFLVGSSWFYHSPPTEVDLFFIFLVLANGLVFVSPIFMNAVALKISQKYLGSDTL